jgi:hypothetical protein
MLITHNEGLPVQDDGAHPNNQSVGAEVLSPAEIPAELLAAVGNAATDAYGTQEVSSAPAVIQNNETHRDHEVFRVHKDPDTYEVHIESDITLADYERITPPEDMKLLKEWAEPLQGKIVDFLNPTVAGGGVAMMRPAMIHLLRELGVDAHWFAMEQYSEAKPEGAEKDPAKNPFIFTKMMHNISQRRLPTDVRITAEGKALHKAWAAENFEVLKEQPEIRNADIIVYDDPQPVPLIRMIEEINPGHKKVWRNHIDTHGELMADPTTPQGEVAHYLLYELGMIDVDAAIAHPNEQFVHHELSDRTYFAPATTEPHDDLNRPLNEQEKAEGLAFINEEIALKNVDLIHEGRIEDIISRIDPDRQLITLIARFDESKGMDKAMELGVQTRRKLRDQGIAEENLPQVSPTPSNTVCR